MPPSALISRTGAFGPMLTIEHRASSSRFESKVGIAVP
jgi:hypothetical protein